MTEAEWLASTSPIEMLEFLGRSPTDRQWRRFGYCCCDGIRPLLTDERSRHAIDVADSFADGFASKDELETTRRGAREAVRYVAGLSYPSSYARNVAKRAAEAVAELVGKSVFKVAGSISTAVIEAASVAAGLEGAKRGVYASFCSAKQQSLRTEHTRFLHNIFGNPFRPVAFDAAWRTSTAVMLARGMYESRDFSPMPILADALQDAGCDSADILNHCRDPRATHVRGCWVVDLTLGKS
jgi:hypothetical protein